MANIMKLMKQAADMQKNMAQAQEALAALELEHSSGGGAVTVKISGDGNITALRIDPKVIQPGEAEMLEDLVLTAVRGAQDENEIYAGESRGNHPFCAVVARAAV